MSEIAHPRSVLIAGGSGGLGAAIAAAAVAPLVALLQITHNLLLFGMTPQEAIEAPRFRSMAGLRVSIEDRVSNAALMGLTSRGHQMNVIEGWTATFGGAQMIVYDREHGVLTAAADPRREAYALAY